MPRRAVVMGIDIDEQGYTFAGPGVEAFDFTVG